MTFTAAQARKYTKERLVQELMLSQQVRGDEHAKATKERDTALIELEKWDKWASDWFGKLSPDQIVTYAPQDVIHRLLRDWLGALIESIPDKKPKQESLHGIAAPLSTIDLVIGHFIQRIAGVELTTEQIDRLCQAVRARGRYRLEPKQDVEEAPEEAFVPTSAVVYFGPSMSLPLPKDISNELAVKLYRLCEDMISTLITERV